MPIPYDLTVLIPFVVLAFWIFSIGKSAKSNFLAVLFVLATAYFIYDEFAEAQTIALGFRDSFTGMILLSLLSLVLSYLKKNKRFYWLATVGLVLLSLYMNGVFDSKTLLIYQNTKADQSGEVLIAFKKPMSLEEAQILTKDIAVDIEPLLSSVRSKESTELDDVFVLNINELTDDFVAFRQLSALPEVDWVEWNEVLTLDKPISSSKTTTSSFNDPQATFQWSLNSFDIDKMQSQTRQLKPQKKAVIAILDTGVDAKHEDLTGIIVSKYRTSTDKNGHGTHCAGLAAAIANNGVGIASMNEKGNFLSILPIAVLSPGGRGTQATILRGIMQAADEGVDVISLSLGGPSLDSRQEAYTDAVAYANANGAVVVVAAGNNNRDAKNYTPANVDGVITVTALNDKLQKAYFSNYVSNLKQVLAAPGEAIHSTYPGNSYKSLNGTSMATPFVAGAAGMLKALQPDLTPKQVYHILNETANSHADQHKIGRIINPMAALNEVMD